MDDKRLRIERAEDDMDRVNEILRHPEYMECVKKVQDCERDRIFCCHQTEHFLDVARIAYILNLEEQLEIPRDIIYAAALLHDIGRYEQYIDGTPHEEASARIATVILEDCGYISREIRQITDAILSHRDMETARKKPLSQILYRADKASRACFSCNAQEQCDWKEEKKNLNIRY